MQTYRTYFKREFDKKHENSGVLARFVLFLSGMQDKNKVNTERLICVKTIEKINVYP